jgi:hypothetical protein
MPGRILRLALALLLAAIVLHSTAWAAGHAARHAARVHRPNVPVLGWYTDLTNNSLAAYHRNGMSLVVSGGGDDAHIESFLNRAAKAGVRVLLLVNGAWTRDGDWTDLRAFIQRYRSSPALYGWYLFDEPDLNGLPAARLAAAYRVVKSVDGRHSIAAIFTTGNCDFGRQLNRGYLNGFDLLMFDDYPFYSFMRSHADSVAGIDEFHIATRDCVAAAHRFHKQGPIMVEQSFGNGFRDGPYMFRDPTYAEEKAMFVGAVKAGVPGILFFHDLYADRHMRAAVHSIVSSWYRTIPLRFRPRLPVPETVPPPAPSAASASSAHFAHSSHSEHTANTAPSIPVPAPTGPPDPPLFACPAAHACAS